MAAPGHYPVVGIQQAPTERAALCPHLATVDRPADCTDPCPDGHGRHRRSRRPYRFLELFVGLSNAPPVPTCGQDEAPSHERVTVLVTSCRWQFCAAAVTFCVRRMAGWAVSPRVLCLPLSAIKMGVLLFTTFRLLSGVHVGLVGWACLVLLLVSCYSVTCYIFLF